MKLEEKLSIGTPRIMGAHTFQADEIITFAAKYDPQPFHLSDEAAKHTHFGKLCASGWHTAAVWMRKTVDDHGPMLAEIEAKGGGSVEFGPALGVKNIRWPNPVFVGDTITCSRLLVDLRPSASRPGWFIATGHGEGINQNGKKVYEFDSTYLLRDVPA